MFIGDDDMIMMTGYYNFLFRLMILVANGDNDLFVIVDVRRRNQWGGGVARERRLSPFVDSRAQERRCDAKDDVRRTWKCRGRPP